MNANEQSKKTKHPPYMQNRELSWLDFNKRVLDQGADDTVAPLERLNFVSIFWSNLKEFFMIRVGSLTDLSLVKKLIIDSKSGMTPSQQLDAVYERCHELYPYYERTYKDLCDLLTDEGVVHLHKEDLDEKALAYLDKYVHDNVMPILSPQIINTRHPFPHLENGRLYIIVRLNDRKSKAEKAAQREERAEKAAQNAGLNTDDSQTNHGDSHFEQHDGGAEGKSADKASSATKNLGAEGVILGLIPLPNQCERIIKLPGKRFRFVLLEQVIEMYAAEIFSMYKVKHTNIICVTRNADLDATEGTDEQGEDYREHMKRILKKRSRLAPVRLETQRPLSSTVKPMLLERLNLKEHQVFVSSVPLDMSYTFDLANYLSPKRKADLTQAPFTPSWPASLERNTSIIEQVSQHEVLMNYPYESMDPFVALLREAANDPNVLSIKITLYRLANQSHIAEALIAAAEAGKEVTALFELRARFDESNNIEWSQRFEQAGCHVIYGFRDFKVHSKICSITRQTKDGLQHITQLGTGNYNEKTARLYTDYSFITTDPSIGHDAVQFFHNMALENTSDDYDILWVAPLQIKQNILALIDEQIKCAHAGQPSGLFFKTNSITDIDIIKKIVEASQAGVPCTLFVRSISCIVPGVKDYTENVRVVSIVGRLLEHSRIYCFGPRNACRIYLSSADLMTRNMDKRIEIAWPVLGEKLHEDILRYLATCMADTAKLRELKPDGSYTPLRYFATHKHRSCSEDSSGYAANSGSASYSNAIDTNDKSSPVLFDSQNALINEAQRRRLIATELRAAREANQSAYSSYFTDNNGTAQSDDAALAVESELQEFNQNATENDTVSNTTAPNAVSTTASIGEAANRQDEHKDEQAHAQTNDQTNAQTGEQSASQTQTQSQQAGQAEQEKPLQAEYRTNEQAETDQVSDKTESDQAVEIIEVPTTDIEMIPISRQRNNQFGFGFLAGNFLRNVARAAAPVARGAGRLAARAAATATSVAIVTATDLLTGGRGNQNEKDSSANRRSKDRQNYITHIPNSDTDKANKS